MSHQKPKTETHSGGVAAAQMDQNRRQNQSITDMGETGDASLESVQQRKIDTNAQTATSAMQTIETNTEYDEFDGSTMITPNDNGDGNAEYDESTMLVGSVL